LVLRKIKRVNLIVKKLKRLIVTDVKFKIHKMYLTFFLFTYFLLLTFYSLVKLVRICKTSDKLIIRFTSSGVNYIRKINCELYFLKKVVRRRQTPPTTPDLHRPPHHRLRCLVIWMLPRISSLSRFRLLRHIGTPQPLLLCLFNFTLIAPILQTFIIKLTHIVTKLTS
jgi:hypothetical protein